MEGNKKLDVIIVGGSYAGLSAAMSLGRALRQVLIIDSGEPCNWQTPHSHNFITQDGNPPRQIAATAKEQVLKYGTVKFHEGLAVRGRKTETGFEIETQAGEVFSSRKLLFATGLKDMMPPIEGIAACWGISVLHCPYCHGYEVKNERTGILANGDMAFEFGKLIHNWTKDLTVFTNGPSRLTGEQASVLEEHHIRVNEKEVSQLLHHQGQLHTIVFKDLSEFAVKALYARPAFTQHCSIPEELGCELTEQGLLKTDIFQKTTVEGVFACGDNSTLGRAVSLSVAAGTMAGASLNKELIEEAFRGSVTAPGAI